MFSFNNFIVVLKLENCIKFIDIDIKKLFCYQKIIMHFKFFVNFIDHCIENIYKQ